MSLKQIRNPFFFFSSLLLSFSSSWLAFPLILVWAFVCRLFNQMSTANANINISPLYSKLSHRNTHQNALYKHCVREIFVDISLLFSERVVCCCCFVPLSFFFGRLFNNTIITIKPINNNMFDLHLKKHWNDLK